MPRPASVSRHPGRRGRMAFRGLAILLSALMPLAGAAPALAQSEANAPVSPPTLAGQLTRVSGTVSFHTAGETTWQAADPNYPITSGNSLWTQPGSGASVVFAASRIAMDQATELDIATLDQHRLVATVPQGAVFLRLRDMQPGDEAVIETPRGTVAIGQDGTYEIAAGDQANPTTVTVMQGAAQIYGNGVSAMVPAGQTANITGSGPFVAQVGPAQQDPFLAAQLASEPGYGVPLPPPPPVAPPPAVAQMTGGYELMNTGTWQQTPQYGAVWYPPVASGWVPYREGHWAWVPPWGWTWVDDAPWGFAPFHYGRWVEYGGRWGWVPVAPGVVVSISAPPVYAPALVAFFGIGVGVGLLLGGAHPVGWCPLGPEEPFHPWYHASPAYIREVNRVNVVNINRINVTNVYNTTTINRFVNRNAVTVVPAQVMADSQHVRPHAQRITPADFGQARPFTSLPVRPVATTAGLTPGAARQFGVTPVVPPQRRAPGPVVQPVPRPGAAVPLRPRGGAPVVHPPGVPAAAPVPVPPRPGVAPGVQRAPTTPVPPRPGVAPGVQRAPTTPVPPRPPVQQPHVGAPGPAIAPHAPGAPGQLPALRPVTPQPQPQRLGPTPQPGRLAPAPAVRGFQQPAPAQQAPRVGAPGPAIAPRAPSQLPALRPVEPRPVEPRPVPAPAVRGFQQPAPTPRPQTQPQRIAPTPQPRPQTQPQRLTPTPQPRPQTQPQRIAPPPQPPPPQQQEPLRRPQQGFNVAPQPHYAAAMPRYTPQPHYAVAMPRYSPPPQPHYAPRPGPRACPPGHPRC